MDAQVSEEACHELRKAGYEAASFPGDMLDEAFPKKLIDDVLQKWGKINCLINNAGMSAYCMEYLKPEVPDFIRIYLRQRHSQNAG